MVEITIRGAGIFGLSIAWAAVRRGARVRLVDPNGAGSGSSGGIVGALAPHVPENWNAKKAFQLESLLMAEAWWREVADAGGVDPGYARTGRLQPIEDAAALALAQTRAMGAEALWAGHAEWRVEQAGCGQGWTPPSATGYVIRDTLSARIHPRRACAALVAALQARGVRVQTAAPDVGQVVHAKGWQGLLALSRETGHPLGNGVKGQAVLLALDRRDAPQLFADGIHIIPHADGTTAIGSTSEREFERSDATDGRLDALLARARSLAPELATAEVLARWAGVRPRARSRAPMMGSYPGRPGHFVANGGFKIGFGMAPRVAEVMADLLLDGRDAIPEGFRPVDSMPKGMRT